ncbi:hypothetical protein LQR31_15160 [Chromobacterium vaccinii]|uniref:hypothetical protein n=1 Tax=Chromobacterium vaccinii TaxID=1108595 RepID=UPI001E3D8E6B|nr:hypothetical protein [Chromobacterium vaccinii]MCD4485814.1 hypothetical protein [Chromobacterium vaccinii]
MLLAMVRNLDAGVVDTDIFLDVNHQLGDGAAVKVCKLVVDSVWPRLGKARGFRYFSAELSKNWLEC